tara:strand:+ start:346 stop:1023 length:678 start_codon:yes stop_codon:yes gene_type:complete
MKFKKLFLLILPLNYLLAEIPPYSAKYNFESDEISITGIREFKKDDEDEIRFEASNLLAKLFFSSKFKTYENNLIPNTYDIKIRPKFLNRDQSIKFNYQNNEINSKGVNEWSSEIDDKNTLYDPLNVQIMIRTFVKQGLTNFDLKIIDMEKGGYKTYSYSFLNKEECYFDKQKYECLIYERTQANSKRKVTYYLVKELEFMFLKIIDVSPERVNKLELKEILSFG